MNTILGEIGKTQKFIDLNNRIENKKSPIQILGLTDVGMLQIIGGINEFDKKPICIITYNEIQAKKIYEDIKYFTDKVVLFPKKEIVTYDYIAESKDLPYERIETLDKIISKKNLIVVTTIEAVIQNIPAKETLYKNEIEFKIGETYNLEEIKQRLVKLGYSRYDLIEGKGQFSVRGGILDISVTENVGVRVEFWGDEVDSIRNFNITSQRSINTLEKAKIYPAHEYILEKPIDEICKKIRNLEGKEYPKEILEEDIEQIKAGNYISKIDKYFNCFYEKQTTILDYLNKNYLIVLDEQRKIKQRVKNIINDNKNLIKALIEKEKIVPQALNDIIPYDVVEEKLEKENKNVIYLNKQDIITKKQSEKYTFEYREINYYKSEIESLFTDLKNALQEEKNIYILVETKEKAKKLKEILEKEEIPTKIEEKLDKTIIVKSKEKIVTISLGKLSEGYENFEINQIVISADDLIDGGKRKRTIANKAYKEGEKVVFADLKVGDYVVHRTYGIGIYIGVNTITADGTTKDYIKIKYQNDDILYVPTNQLDSIR